MAFSHLQDSIKETIDRIDGYKTGRLIVELDRQSLSLEQSESGKISYLPLPKQAQIEVRGDDGYKQITFEDALETKESLLGSSLYAGLYARVKFLSKEEHLENFPKLMKLSDMEALNWYTSEVVKVTKGSNNDQEYLNALAEWKNQMNKRFKKTLEQGFDR